MITRRALLIVSAAVVLAACGRNEPPVDEMSPDITLDEQTNRFLEQNDIVLPEGAERVNLSGSDGSGIATREVEAGRATFTVLADLPEPTAGQYYAWVDAPDGAAMSLGMMLSKKGGYVVEKSVSGSFDGAVEVRVSREKGNVTTPSNTMLTGEFK